MINVQELIVTRAMSVSEGLALLDKVGTGVLLLADQHGYFERTITDGDLRRLLLKNGDLNQPLADLSVIRSVVVHEGCSRREALALMNEHKINHLPVVDASRRVIGLLERQVIDQQILLSTPHLGDEERSFVEDAFRSNWVAPLGPNVDAFERELSEIVDAKYATALSSGTAAIHLSLRLLDVSAGDTVFCSSLTFAASANPIMYQGAEPVFIDSDEESWNMSPVALGRALAWAKQENRPPKAVIVVNLYGQSADMDPLLELCNAYGVPLIEDAAESLGARYKGRASGTFGKMGVYSFNGNKIITTSGGGMLLADDPELIKRAVFLATQARDPARHYQHSEIGFNYRMSNILAGVGRGQLRVLEQRVEARRAVFERYKTELTDVKALEWMPEPPWSYSTHWLTACTINPKLSPISSTEFIDRLASEMIEARPIWKPMHLQPVFAEYKYFTDGGASVSDRLFQQGVCLPSGSNMPAEAQGRIIEVIRGILR
ncbi:MAG: aminotransferase class I/II-fold pyridoxal phosphate-dependent enzyme [Massilia sp.]|nr:aminotransferase class I/II-fold pyridoxal phosphate-dependent enzyme [Massilia sp.]